MIEKIKNEQKKGIALNQAFGAVLSVVLIGVLVIIAIFIFVNLGASFNTVSTTVTGETLPNNVTEIGQRVTNQTACGFQGISNVVAVNATGTLIEAGNYTVNSAIGEINATATAGDFNNTVWTLNYTSISGGEACVANQTMITQFGTFPVLVGLVGTIVFLGLVIGVLVASFVFGGRRGV